MNEAIKPAIRYATKNLVPASQMISVNGLFIRQRVDIDPLYDGPLYGTAHHDSDAGFYEPNASQIAAANRVIDGSKDPEPVLTRLLKCKGFRRIEPEINAGPVAASTQEPMAESPTPETYQFAIPPEAMFGKLAELARASECPLSWAFPSLLAYYAGLGINMHDPDPKIHPTVYVALLGNVEDGKSVTMKRTRQMLGLKPEDMFPSPASDRGLISSFRVGPDGAPLDKKEKPGSLIAGTVLADEMREMMSKMAIQGSTLAPRLCELWSTDTLSASDKFGVQTMKARVSLLGNLKIKDRDEFPVLFAGNTQDGLFSRMIIAAGPTNWAFDWKWEPPPVTLYAEADAANAAEVAALMAHQPYLRPNGRVTVPTERYTMLDQWKQAHQEKGVKAGRVGEIALRVAIITASANGDSHVSAECMTAALAFADWQMRVKNVYAAGEGRSDEAILTGLIEDAFIEIDYASRAGKPILLGGKPIQRPSGFVIYHLLEKKKRWGRTFSASAVTRVLASLTKNGILEQDYDEDEKTKRMTPANRYRLNTSYLV